MSFPHDFRPVVSGEVRTTLQRQAASDNDMHVFPMRRRAPRILVVDVYEALRTARPYKPALPHDEAARTMREEARQGLWDAELVNEFFNMLVEKRSVA